jgi:hypothetical protein
VVGRAFGVVIFNLLLFAGSENQAAANKGCRGYKDHLFHCGYFAFRRLKRRQV